VNRLRARLSGSFGILASVLVVVGLHGVLSYFLHGVAASSAFTRELRPPRHRHAVQCICAMLVPGFTAATIFGLLAAREASALPFGV
jgi:hypothetical protein